MRQGRGGGGAGELISTWEWIAAAVGAALVFGAVGMMLHEAVTRPDTPPRVEVTVDTVVAQPTGYLVRIRARNRGHSTAAALEIEGELIADTGTVQTSRTTIDYLPERTARTAGLFFEHDPRLFTLRLRAVGYDDP